MKYNLWDKATIDKILLKNGFSFKKSLGQNFLTNPEVCPEMARISADENTGIIEIGPGIGVLTAELALVAKRVVAIELDERLKPVLAETLSEFDNVEVIFSDVLKTDLDLLIKEKFKDCSRVNVCANLPYYITSPVIMSLLEKKLPISSITVMIQKETAERLCADIPGRDVGAVTLAANYYCERNIMFHVRRDSFNPSPKVDSAVIQLTLRNKPADKVISEKVFFELIKSSFIHRRKTLVNSVSACGTADKTLINDFLASNGLNLSIRAEQMKTADFAKLADIIYKSRQK